MTTHNLRDSFFTKLILVAFATLLSFAGYGATTASATGSASIILSPSSASYNVGTSFNITVIENSGGTAINAVQTDLTYDSSKLQFTGINTSSSAFNLAGPSSGGSGSVNISRAKSPGTVTGSQTVAVVSFKVLAAGTSNVSVASSSGIVDPGGPTDVWNGAINTATLTLKEVSSGGDSSGGSTSVGASTSGSSSGGSSSSVSSPTSNTESPGTDKPSSTSSPTSSDEKTVGFPLDPKEFQSVAIKVVDKGGKPVVNAKVTLSGQTSTTDESGIAGFSDIIPGEYDVVIEYDSKKYDQKVSVVKGVSTEVQSFDTPIPIGTSRSSLAPIITAAILLPLAVLTVVLGIKFAQKRKLAKFYANTANPEEQQTVVHNNPSSPPGTTIEPNPKLPQQNKDSK